MYAVQQPSPQPRPPRRSGPARRPRSRHDAASYRLVAVETAVKLGVNVALSLAAIVALVQLLPFQSNQEAKLDELQVAVKSTNERVSRIRSNFSYYFDPSQTGAIMKEQSNRIAPNQRQIVWQEPGKGY